MFTSTSSLKKQEQIQVDYDGMRVTATVTVKEKKDASGYLGDTNIQLHILQQMAKIAMVIK